MLQCLEWLHSRRSAGQPGPGNDPHLQLRPRLRHPRKHGHRAVRPQRHLVPPAAPLRPGHLPAPSPRAQRQDQLRRHELRRDGQLSVQEGALPAGSAELHLHGGGAVGAAAPHLRPRGLWPAGGPGQWGGDV